jgi:hypothetical protein
MALGCPTGRHFRYRDGFSSRNAAQAAALIGQVKAGLVSVRRFIQPRTRLTSAFAMAKWLGDLCGGCTRQARRALGAIRGLGFSRNTFWYRPLLPFPVSKGATRVGLDALEKEINEFLSTLPTGAVLNTQTAMAAIRNENDQTATQYVVTIWYQ